MSFAETEKFVPFDPGFSQVAEAFPKEAFDYLNEIGSLKQNHQKKFAFSNLETQIVPIIKLSAAFYLGCILWGSYLFWKHKNNAKEIQGNPVFELSEEEKDKISYNNEVDFILEFIDKFEKSAKFYMKRSSRINPVYLKYFEVYKQFVNLNNNFTNLKFTNEIKLPSDVEHFGNFSEQKLDELKQKIYEIINSGNIESILDLGFVNN